MLAVLKRLVKHLRQAWPETLIVVRGDSHFAYPEVMQWIEAQAQPELCHGLDQQCRVEAASTRGGGAGQTGL